MGGDYQQDTDDDRGFGDQVAVGAARPRFLVGPFVVFVVLGRERRSALWFWVERTRIVERERRLEHRLGEILVRMRLALMRLARQRRGGSNIRSCGACGSNIRGSERSNCARSKARGGRLAERSTSAPGIAA